MSNPCNADAVVNKLTVKKELKVCGDVKVKGDEKICGDLTVKGDINLYGKFNRKYDFIICGFGTTACVIARKLLDAGKSVLVLERGKNNVIKNGILQAAVDSPATSGATNPELTADLPWGISTLVNRNISSTGAQRTTNYAEGNGWGGGGSHFYMNHYRGSDYVWNDYDESATGMPGGNGPWGYNQILPYLKATENFVLRNSSTVPGGPNSPPLVMQSDRATGGPITVVQRDNFNVIQANPLAITFATSPTVGLGWTEDLNSNNTNSGLNYSKFNQVGVGFAQRTGTLPLTTIGAASRGSTLKSFMSINTVIDENGNGLNGNDVKVYSNVIVNKVLFEGTKAIGVEYLQDFETYLGSTVTTSPLTFPLSGFTINVVSTAGFPTALSAATNRRLTINGFYGVSYTGVTATQFLGCTSIAAQAGVVSAGATIGRGIVPPTAPVEVPPITTTGGQINLIRPYANLVPSDYSVAYGDNIILCAGVHNTPMILQRSGVGDPVLLNSLGIPVIIANTNVGNNLTAHINFNLTLTGPALNVPPIPSNAFNCGFNLHGLPPPYDYTDNQIRQIQGSVSANNGGIATNMYKPKSTGFIKITSKDPTALPNINFQMLTDPGSSSFPPANGSDMNRCLTYFKILQSIIANSGGVITNGTNGTAGGNITFLGLSDSQLVDYIKDNIAQQNHDSGTCRMSPTIATGVVDVNLKVHGASNLYCADASIFPYANDGNPNAALTIIGLRLMDSLGLPALPLPPPQ